MTQKEDRYQLRCKIANYCCRKSRTHSDVAKKFNMSGISAGAYLKFLTWDNILEYDHDAKRFIRIKGAQVSK